MDRKEVVSVFRFKSAKDGLPSEKDACCASACSLSAGFTETYSTKRCARRLRRQCRHQMRNIHLLASLLLYHRSIRIHRESTARDLNIGPRQAILSCAPAAGRRPGSRVLVEAAVPQRKPGASAEASSQPRRRCQVARIARLAAARRSEPIPHIPPRRGAGSAASPTAAQRMHPAVWVCCRPRPQRAARLLLRPLRLAPPPATGLD